ncbi:TIGR01777 family oxidoreductase [Bacteriovorax sp. PP10]|uniref:TIGR01777 family oxidoreductase n=1 Tax=Bacteriovorax antarcticus TaxID=3088717 RepID=A0ABU5VWF7_9BACT|nr:TIGR01777 family oxidoreductase [Bacteriovorax sp. PP10]MEA9356360.1 TIGR01777 family oxidoreductase [Bacteriovorax sp. PP10]
MKILITGATGFVGSALAKKLLDSGHELNILTRSRENLPDVFKNSRVTAFEWKDTSVAPPIESISGINGVINLMGENISAKRWSNEQKIKLHTSRVESTKNLTNLLNHNLTAPLDFFISASAVGIYPVGLTDCLNEDSKTGKNFLAELCKDWEAAAYTLTKVKRIVIIRTAVVLEKNGGALTKMLPPFKLGLGGPIGNGNQYMSWIHLDDLVNIYTKAATDPKMSGVYNAAAPHPTDNFHFTKALGKVLHKPTLIPVPAAALKIAFGEMSSVILDSQKVISKRLPEEGITLQYETIESAMNKIFETR